MKLRLLLLLALLCSAGCWTASAQWAPESLNYGWGHLRDGKHKLSDLEVQEIIGQDIYQQTYVSARKQYKAGLGLLIGGGAVSLGGMIITGRSESFVKDKGKKAIWTLVKESWNKGEIDGSHMDQAAEDIAKGLVWYFCGAGISYVGTIVLRVGIPIFIVGSKRLDWIADDYNERHQQTPVLEMTATPYGPGLRLSF